MGCCAGHKPFIMAATDDASPPAITDDSSETFFATNFQKQDNQNDGIPEQKKEPQTGTVISIEDNAEIRSLVIRQEELERIIGGLADSEIEGEGMLSRHNRESLEEKHASRKHLHGPAVRVPEEASIRSGPQREYVPDSIASEPAQAGQGNPLAPPSPIRWFPRAKKESFLERKIRLLQERDGGDQRSLDETLDTAPTKLSLVEREQQAATIAAIAASATRHSALVEASWCRILDAANIPSPSSMEAAKLAETRAEDALMAATKLGVVLNDQGDTPGDARQGLPGGITRKDAILTSVKNIQEVEKEVVMAVTQALRAITEERGKACVKANLPDPELIEAASSSVPTQCHGFSRVSDKDVSKIENTTSSVDGLPETTSSEEGDRRVLNSTHDLEGSGQMQLSQTTEEGGCQQSDLQPGEPHGGSSTQLHSLVDYSARAEAGDGHYSSSEQPGMSSAVGKTRRPAWQDVATQATALDDASPSAEANAADHCREGLESTGCSVREVESLGQKPVDRCGNSENLSMMEIRKDMPLEEVMLSRVRSLAEEQQTSLAAIVATKGLVNELLEELKDVRKTGVRRSSGGGLGDMVKHVSRLQKEKALAEAARDGETKKKSVAVKVNRDGDLGSVLRKHVSRFERDVLAARERAKVSPEPKRVSKRVQAEVMPGEGLGEVLVKHTSRLQREKEEALISDAAGEKETNMGKGVRNLKSKEDDVQNSLGADFKKGLSRLEREKMAAKASDGDLTPYLGKASAGRPHAGIAGLGESMIKHKSALQREIEASRSEAAQFLDSEAADPKPDERLVAARSSEGGLDSFVKRKSKLQMEVEKARSEGEADTSNGYDTLGENKSVEALQQTSGAEGDNGEVLVRNVGRAAAAGGTAEWGPLGDNFVPRISKLEMEKLAAAEGQRAEEDGRKGQRGSAARVKTPEVDPWGGESLGSSLVKHVSRLERDKAAWRKAEEEAQRAKA